MISETQFILSGRYHHLIFAANTGVPTCFLGTSSHKIHGLAELLTGDAHYDVYDPTNIQPYITKIVNHCFSLPSELNSCDQMYLRQQYIEYIESEF